MDSVTMLVHIVEGTSDNRSTRSTNIRIVYGVTFLRRARPARGNFTEAFHTHMRNGRVLYRHGSEKERLLPSPSVKTKRWFVEVTGRAGEQRTIVTCATLLGRDELRCRTVHGFGILGAADEAFFYPNDAEDEIRELTMFVEWEGRRLLAGRSGDAMRWLDATFVRAEPDVPSIWTSSSREARSVVSVRWRDVKPGEVVGVRMRARR